MSVSAITEPVSTVGEGPHWEEATQSLLYVDILAGDIHRWNSVTKQNEKIHVESTVGFVVPRKSGGYVIGMKHNFAHVNWSDQKISIIGDEVDAGLSTQMNDGKCDASGRVWAGTMHYEGKGIENLEDVGSLYRLDCSGQVTKQLDKITVSNGLAWTADNSVMYYIDSMPRKVYAFDYDLGTGDIGNQRVAIDFGGEETMESLGYPDGMTIDTDGKLWVACAKAGKVIQFDAETGKELRSVSFPTKMITSCCFGGPKYDELYVTSLRYGQSEEQLKASPLDGACFKVTGLGVKGTAPYVYQG